jgi:voltage-gated potassium channel
VSIGTAGYIILERYNFLDALYMTIISITTVGYGEVHPLSDAGRVFTIFLLVTNIGIFLYGITTIAGFLLEGEFRKILKNIKLEKVIGKLQNHVIVCGYGRNGKQVCLELIDDKIPYVVVENDEKIHEELVESNILYIHGNATESNILKKAGIERAKAIITTLPKDPDNVYVVLCAREMNKDIIIISRASDDSSVNKLKRAGANNVIMPEKIGGAHMAALVTKPDITEFIALLTGQGSDISLTFEELPLSNLHLSNKQTTIRDLDIRNLTGANIIGLRGENGEYIINPSPDTLINPNAKLILLGSESQIQKMRKLISEL